MAGRSVARRNGLVEAHLHLVEPIARMVARRAPVSIDLDDLVQAGTLGLLQAAETWRAGRAPFAMFARTRIRGAMLDTLRRRHWRDATHAALDADAPDREPLADEMAMRGEQARRVRAALDSLPSREAQLIEAHVMEAQPLRAAAAALRISQARASQLKARGLARLRDRLPEPD